MRPLPNSERAFLDIRKIEDYCLNPTHPRGRHKARVFRAALGIGRSDATWLRQILLEGVRKGLAIQLSADAFGTRWYIDMPIERQGKAVVVRTIWIMRLGEETPQFVTCWVL